MTDSINDHIDRVVAEIDKLGDRSCCYMGKEWPERICDCKYRTGPNADRAWGQGEVTGCPELRDIRRGLLNLKRESPKPEGTLFAPPKSEVKTEILGGGFLFCDCTCHQPIGPGYVDTGTHECIHCQVIGQ